MNAKYLAAEIIPSNGRTERRCFAASEESIAALLRQYRDCAMELKTLDGRFFLSYHPEDAIRACADPAFFRELLLPEMRRLADHEKEAAEIQWVNEETVSPEDILCPDWNIFREYGTSDRSYQEQSRKKQGGIAL